MREVRYKGRKIKFQTHFDAMQLQIDRSIRDNCFVPQPERNETMFEESLEWLKSTVLATKRSKFVRRPGDPAHKIWEQDVEGKLTEQDVEPGVRTVQVNRFSDLIGMARSHFDTTVRDDKRVMITYAPGQVELVFDHKTGRERATLALHGSRELQFFNARLGNPQIDPGDFYKALKYDLAQTYSDPKLLQQVAKISFSDHSQSAQNSARGSESMGNLLEKQVQEPQTLPAEGQTFRVRSYMNPELSARFDLKTVLDPDPSSRQWNLWIDPQSWVDMQNKNLDLIGGVLRDAFEGDENVTILQGSFEQEQPDFTAAD